MAWGWTSSPPNPEVKKNEFPTSGEAASGEFKFFFTEGWGGNSPIPPRHHQAIISVTKNIVTYMKDQVWVHFRHDNDILSNGQCWYSLHSNPLHQNCIHYYLFPHYKDHFQPMDLKSQYLKFNDLEFIRCLDNSNMSRYDFKKGYAEFCLLCICGSWYQQFRFINTNGKLSS